MISLRGILRKDSDDGKTDQWRWTGHWAFGALGPVPPAPPPPTATKRFAPQPQLPEPFAYTWSQASLPSQVPVPSAANLSSEIPKEEETPKSAATLRSSSSSPVGATPNKEEKQENPPNNPDATKVDTTSDSTTKADSKTTGEENDTVNPADSKKDDPSDKPSVRIENETATESKAIDPMQTDYKESDSQQTVPMDIDKQTKDDKEKSSTDTPKKSSQATAGPVAADDDNNNPTNQQDFKTPKKDDTDDTNPPKPVVTFATQSEGDPPFTDASVLHPDKCPPGGQWTGYFENTITKRKERISTQVAETFYLFFNSTPPKDARVEFVDDTTAKTTPNAAGLLPPGHIHVRGMGENQFGTFELVGSYHLETGVLACQRMYVITPDPASSRSSRRSSATTPVSSMVTRGLRSQSDRSTRKRGTSWRRKSPYSDSDEETGPTPRRSASNSARKRNRSDSKSSTASAPPAATQPARPTVITTAATTAVKRPNPSPRNVGPRKRSATPSRNAATAASTNSTYMKLPPVGDPKKARWRAAHFLYYQRNEPLPADDTNSSPVNTTPQYVVYEGDMLNSLRDGYGICLYFNGLLYEGGWKRNKEHGKGKLMTADRKKIIYEGDWERGRMHGTGTYYYGHADRSAIRKKDKNPKEGSRYEGDFKENLRHGFGTYVLPDGSTYAGMWREGVMSGRGVFTWPDKSVYDGEWRDGTRNGMGILRASDGFIYDGMWVNNAMEGRGSAIYPNGQRYDGLFSDGKREGRGTIYFTNGAVYEGRFRKDRVDGQGTMKMSRTLEVPDGEEKREPGKEDFMIPVSFQSDMGRIHQKAGFTVGGE